ncbi:MAG: beta-xylosidase, partial [Sphingomonas sp.]|nr:beta-xylosidase [Sphingomonas sp.]
RDADGRGHVRMGIATQLQVADREFAAVEATPAFRAKPIVIGESDPEGCAACKGPANAYRNGTMYSSYTVASFPRLQALAARRHLALDGILTWAFEFEDQPYFAGFRQLTSAGIDLPVMNVFKLFAMMRGMSIQAISDHQLPLDTIMQTGVRDAADVGSVAARDGNRVTVLVWHYHDDDLPGPDAAVHLDLAHLPPAFRGGARLTEYRIDRDHSNAYAAWLAMGSPEAPSDAQRATLLQAAKLAPMAAENRPLSKAGIDLTLPRQGVALLVINAGAD